jgi:hypothetical protein
MAPPPGQQQQHLPPLLRLPAELRRTIYQDVFRGSRIHIYALSHTPRRSGSRWFDNPEYWLCNSALLLVCKALLADAAPDLYSATRLVIHGLDTPQCLTSLVPAPFLARVKHVHLADVERVFAPYPAPLFPLPAGTAPPTFLFDPDALPALEVVTISNGIFECLIMKSLSKEWAAAMATAIDQGDKGGDRAIVDLVHEDLFATPQQEKYLHPAEQRAVSLLRDNKKAPRSYRVIGGFGFDSPEWRQPRKRLVSPVRKQKKNRYSIFAPSPPLKKPNLTTRRLGRLDRPRRECCPREEMGFVRLPSFPLFFIFF